MGNRGLFIVQIRSDITDVRIRQTDNLPRIARVRENFLISGETGIENDFTATTCAGPRGASPKNSSIFECKCALPFDSFCQRSLSLAGFVEPVLFFCGLQAEPIFDSRRLRAEPVLVRRGLQA